MAATDAGPATAPDPVTRPLPRPVVVDPTTAVPAPYPIAATGRSRQSTTAASVIDGDSATFWATAPGATPDTAQAFVDLGAARPVASVRWMFSVGGMADAVRIQISKDGERWKTVGDASRPDAGTWYELPIASRVRYVRFVFDNPDGAARLGGLGEVEVRPPVGTPAPATGDPSPPTAPPAPADQSADQVATPDPAAVDATPLNSPPADPAATATATPLDPPPADPAEETATEPVAPSSPDDGAVEEPPTDEPPT